MSRRGGAVFVLGCAALLAACSGSSVEARARKHAADRLGTDADSLRVTERTELSTPQHAFMRVGERDRARELTVVVARSGSLIVDSTSPDAFAKLAAAERVGRRFPELGGHRIAGWFGALSGGKPCGEPLQVASEKSVVTVEAGAAGGHHLAYDFDGGGKMMRCHVSLSPEGGVIEAHATLATVAQGAPKAVGAGTF